MKVSISFSFALASLLLVGRSSARVLKQSRKKSSKKTDCAEGEISSYQRQCQALQEGVREMFRGTVYPENIRILEGGLLPDIFLPDVQGRAQPLGSFSGLNNTLEYFYALTSGDYLEKKFAGTGPTFINVISDLRYVACDVKQRLGTFGGSLNFGIPGVDTLETISASSKLHFTGSARFNPEGRVCSYELNLARLDMFVASSQPSTPTQLILETCLGVQLACQDENQQYESVDDCISFMNSIDYGNFDNADLNSVQCRRLHTILAFSRPEQHCSHCGKDGGGKCIDRDYANVTRGNYLIGADIC